MPIVIVGSGGSSETVTYTYAGHYTEAMIDLEGDALVSTQIKVYQPGGTTLATLYTSRQKTTAASNPATTDIHGNLSIWLDPGDYELAAVINAVEQGRQAASIPVDPGESAQQVADHAALTTGAHSGLVAQTDPRLADSRTPTAGTVTDASVAADAAIAKSKLAPLAIVNADVDAAAAIAKSKLGPLAVVNADVDAAAGIALSKLATDPLARANHTGTQLAATVSNFDTQVRTSRLDQMAAPTAAVTLNSQRITNLALPSSDSDAASKAYADGIASGFHALTAVAVATTANITLSGEQTIDGVLTSASRVLVKNQSAPAENGVYVSAAGAWARATDADSSAELVNAQVFVSAGTVNASTSWTQQTPTPIVVGTTPVTWAQTGASGTVTAGAGLTKTGSTLDVVAADGTLTVAADSVKVATGGITGTEIAAAIKDPAAATPGLRTLGTSATSAAAGNDARLSDTRTPTDASVTNAKVASGAGITMSKLDLTGSVTNTHIGGAAAIAKSKLAPLNIADADVAAGAAIAKSKLAALGIVNADVAAGAGITMSKLNLVGSILNADISGAAAIALSKLAETVTTATGGGKESIQDHGSMGSTEVFDLSNGNFHLGVLSANCAFTFSGATAGKACSFTVKLTQDATGGRTLAWPASVDWPGGIIPSPSTAPNKVSLWSFVSHDGGSVWYGTLVGDDFR